jgi:hypothetical protein
MRTRWLVVVARRAKAEATQHSDLAICTAESIRSIARLAAQKAK